MRRASLFRVAGLCLALSSCAAHGRIATPLEIASLRNAEGLVASGRLKLRNARGSLTIPVVMGALRPDKIRIEVPSGGGIRFLFIVANGHIVAEDPSTRTRFTGAANEASLFDLFGVRLSTDELVASLFGKPPSRASTYEWRFEAGRPREVTIALQSGEGLSFRLDDPELERPPATAFAIDASRENYEPVTALEMSRHLGLRR